MPITPCTTPTMNTVQEAQNPVSKCTGGGWEHTADELGRGVSGTLKDGSGCEQPSGRLPAERDRDWSSVKRWLRVGSNTHSTIQTHSWLSSGPLLSRSQRASSKVIPIKSRQTGPSAVSSLLFWHRQSIGRHWTGISYPLWGCWHPAISRQYHIISPHLPSPDMSSQDSWMHLVVDCWPAIVISQMSKPHPLLMDQCVCTNCKFRSSTQNQRSCTFPWLQQNGVSNVLTLIARPRFSYSIMSESLFSYFMIAGLF